jgi:hypothetical protein
MSYAVVSEAIHVDPRFKLSGASVQREIVSLANCLVSEFCPDDSLLRISLAIVLVDSLNLSNKKMRRISRKRRRLTAGRSASIKKLVPAAEDTEEGDTEEEESDESDSQ